MVNKSRSRANRKRIEIPNTQRHTAVPPPFHLPEPIRLMMVEQRKRTVHFIARATPNFRGSFRRQHCDADLKRKTQQKKKRNRWAVTFTLCLMMDTQKPTASYTWSKKHSICVDDIECHHTTYILTYAHKYICCSKQGTSIFPIWPRACWFRSTGVCVCVCV